METKVDQIAALARKKGQITSTDVIAIGAGRTFLAYMARKGILRRIARGIYVPVEQISENETLQAVTAAVPHGVICLLTALQFHEITTQMPMETWIAIERNRAIPKTKDFALRIVRLEQTHFACGIEEHQIQGIIVRVYSPAKTVVDCFKFRNKVGIDVARETLKESLAQGKATIDEIYHYAKICRMLNVMRPYLEIVR